MHISAEIAGNALDAQSATLTLHFSGQRFVRRVPAATRGRGGGSGVAT